MKLKRNLVLAVLCLSTVTTFGQSEPQSSRIKEPEKITFKPHWFIQACTPKVGTDQSLRMEE